MRAGTGAIGPAFGVMGLTRKMERQGRQGQRQDTAFAVEHGGVAGFVRGLAGATPFHQSLLPVWRFNLVYSRIALKAELDGIERRGRTLYLCKLLFISDLMWNG